MCRTIYRTSVGSSKERLSLVVQLTNIESLSLVSLRHIKSGNVSIVNNSRLCLADTINWMQLFEKYGNQQPKIDKNEKYCGMT
jgi:hypothetical protein